MRKLLEANLVMKSIIEHFAKKNILHIESIIAKNPLLPENYKEVFKRSLLKNISTPYSENNIQRNCISRLMMSLN
jgi:hypothetical protein